MKIFILAAGFGTRLKPITEKIPKPLVPIFNSNSLDINLSKLEKLELKEVFVNTHHLSEVLKEYSQNKNIKLSYEKDILGAGGGIGKLKKQFFPDDVLIHNSDVLTNINISKLIDYHKNQQNWVTLALVNFPKINSVIIDNENNVKTLIDKSKKGFTFSGVSIISKEIYNNLPEDKFHNLIDFYEEILKTKNSNKIKGYVFKNAWWNDIGTLEQYWDFHKSVINNPNKYKKLNINFQSKEFLSFKKHKSIFINSDFKNNIENSIFFENKKIYVKS